MRGTNENLVLISNVGIEILMFKNNSIKIKLVYLLTCNWTIVYFYIVIIDAEFMWISNVNLDKFKSNQVIF